MTTNDFSNEFDTLVNSYATALPYGMDRTMLEFDEYEKSVFLTLALEAIVLNYYSSSTADSFETTEEMRRYLDSIVITATDNGTTDETKIVKSNGTPTSTTGGFSHTIYKLPAGCWFIVYEEALLGGGGSCGGRALEIVPTTHDSVYRTCRNPFRGPSESRILRLDSGNNTVELISKGSVSLYLIRYIKHPSPIILVDLEGVTINGQATTLGCTLNSSLHHRILEMAVQLAIASRSKTTNKQN